jgi:predicted phosphate transport protein (TIGR00153 family)
MAYTLALIPLYLNNFKEFLYRMARFQLLPAETRFYDWFEKGSANLLQIANLLQDMLDNYERADSKMRGISDAERQGDFIVHEIHDLLIKTLITPLDHEETRALSTSIDDVVDCIEQAALLMLLYKIEKPSQESRELAAIIVACAEQINAAMPLIRDKKHFPTVQKHILEVHRLENEADAVGRRALEYLVANSRDDWFEFMRWKETYQLLERAVNLCEDIADVLQTVLVKNG